MDYLGLTVRFVLAVLATWRVTHLLAAEDGPGDITVHFRAKLGNSFAGKLMDCFYCLSIWIAGPAALFVTHNPLDWLMAWLAISGGACLLERATEKSTPVRPVYELPFGGTDHVLRSETSPTQGQSFGLEQPETAGPHAGSAATGADAAAGTDTHEEPGAAHLVSATDWGRASAGDGASSSAASDDAHAHGYR
jgi:Protein of unknown function (DUF1360)